ncbi:MAG TPA: hypothetical protein VHX44_10005, partial [Planctomycetota bacterium]|nr:hypothetical protein [Planctomycetota bacterium]
MTLAQLQDYTFTTKYARWNKAIGRRESFSEAVDRVMGMHAATYAGKDIAEKMAFATSAIKKRLVLGSQRALQFGDKPITNKNAHLY